MGLGGARAALLLGALQVLALAGVGEPPGSSEMVVPLHDSSGNLTETVSSSNASKSSVNSSTVKPLTTTVSLVSINMTTVTMKSTVTSKMATPGVSTSTTPTTSKSTPKATSISQNISQTSTPTMTTTHNSLVTSLTTVHSKENRGSKFDTGSFVGGIVLTLGVLSILYIGCKMYYSRRGIRYRTIDEHDAII
ncbi:porimin isoform 2-T2 [Erethizon dorsatum]